MSEVIDRIGTATPATIDPVVKRMFTGGPPQTPPKRRKNGNTFERVNVGVVSDLHLDIGGNMNPEFWDYEGDVLLIAGDTAEFRNYKRNVEFFQQCSELWKQVLIIAGNHEGYNSSMPDCIDLMKAELEQFSNIAVLENESFVYDGVLFIGATLWSDFNKADPLTMQACSMAMNDYNCIWNSEAQRKLRPEDTLERHRNSKKFIGDTAHYLNEMECVVMTHHAPSRLSTHPKYADDRELNGAYSSDLSDIILNNPNIKAWVHGHTHHRFKYEIGECSVVCNPRGYPGERPTNIAPYQPLIFNIDKG